MDEVSRLLLIKTMPRGFAGRTDERVARKSGAATKGELIRIGISDVRKAGRVCDESEGWGESSWRLTGCENRDRKGEGRGVEASDW